MKNHLVFLSLCCSLFAGCSKDDGKMGVTNINFFYKELLFDAAGGERTVRISFEYDDYNNLHHIWQLTGGASWCIPSRTNGGDLEDILFKVDEYEYGDRETTFTFTCGVRLS